MRRVLSFKKTHVNAQAVQGDTLQLFDAWTTLCTTLRGGSLAQGLAGVSSRWVFSELT